MKLQLTSNAFNDGKNIPKEYTCDGENVSPQLSWSGVPQQAKSLALIADDPDAPLGTWVHWVLYNLPAEQSGLERAVQGVGVAGKNGFKKLGYGGPCPPKGKPHRYFFKLYALDIQLNLNEGATKDELEKAMRGHILAQGQIIGLYAR